MVYDIQLSYLILSLWWMVLLCVLPEILGLVFDDHYQSFHVSQVCRKMCRVTCISSEGPITIPKHINGSRNQVESSFCFADECYIRVLIVHSSNNSTVVWVVIVLLSTINAKKLEELKFEEFRYIFLPNFIYQSQKSV